MSLDARKVRQALMRLAEHLEEMTAEPIELVVCGGSALEYLGFVDRATKDIDVLAFASTGATGNLEFKCAEPFPASLTEAAAIVARDLRLPVNWINSGPTDLLNQGLPDGFAGRLVTTDFGPKLTVHFIGRLDQICFKLYAVINGGAQRHLADLGALTPTDEELLGAARWRLTQDASEIFPALVKSCLEQIGYPHVASAL